MKLADALKDMFPACTRCGGSMAEMDEYATPQNCNILAQGVIVRDVQAGRKCEEFLVEHQGVMMHLNVVDKWLAGGVAKAHVSITRSEGPDLSREELEAWSKRMIEHGSAAAVERREKAMAARRAAR